MGDVVDKVSGAFGVEGSESVDSLDYQPFNVSSVLGSAKTQDQKISAQLSPELQQIYSGLLGQIPGQFQQAASPEAALNFLSSQLAPQFQRQQASQESRLFNQGLLGSTTGQLQTQGLRQAQNQALIENALQAQNQAAQRGTGLLGSALKLGAAPLGLAELGGQFGARQLQADEGTAAIKQQADANQANFFASLVSSGSQFLGR